MKQNNLFNRFFYKETLAEEKEKYEKCKSLVGHFPELDERIRASKSLEGVLELHKKAWGLGYQNDNLAPCEWGMFRTKDISKMTPVEVFLGNVDGLWTFPIPKWSDQKSQMYDKDISVYDVVLNQYKRVLHSNVKAIYREAKDLVEEYEEINPPKDSYKIW
jgi:hypothetical protein